MKPDSITFIIPARNAASRVGAAIRDWSEQLSRNSTAATYLVVDDGSSDDTAAVVERLREKHPTLQLLKHDTPKGVGACLRTALPEARDPLVALLQLDYPYKAGDFAALIKRLEQQVEVFGAMKPVEAVSGCRGGRPVPAFWQFAGKLYRYGTRIVLGFKPEPLKGWLGFRNHWRSWWCWAVFGTPIVDLTCGLKVFRRELFDRFPIQCDGDFVHLEIPAKLTFLGAILAEEALSPSGEAIPDTQFNEFGLILRNAKFHPPVISASSAAECSACPPA